MKTLLIIVFMLAGGQMLLAQSTAFGGGYTSLTLINDFDNKSKNGIHAGIWYNSDDDFFLTGMVYLTLPSKFEARMPGIQKGDSTNWVQLYESVVKSSMTMFDFNYGRYLVGDFTDNFGVFTTYGVALSYYRLDYDIINPGYTKPLDFDQDQLRSRDVMLSGGLGIDYAPHSKGKLSAGVKLYLPLLKISSGSNVSTPYFLDVSISYKYFIQPK
jgi:hypothetical protein